MERCITEEFITKKILQWLVENNWEIICFDYPQSGTWYVLQINKDLRINKWYNSLIPDIVAIKWKKGIFFENKNRFYLPDFYKVNDLIVNNNYKESIWRLLSKYNLDNIYYWIWLPLSDKNTLNVLKYSFLIDFAVWVSIQQDKLIEIIFQKFEDITK